MIDKFSSIRIRRALRQTTIASSSIESSMAKLDAMNEEEVDLLINSFINKMGIKSVYDLVKQFLLNVKNAPNQAKTAQLYEGLKNNPGSSQTPSQLSSKLNKAGNWGYLLALILLIGTAGTSDSGGDWTQILKGFILTAGTGFLAWVIKRLAKVVK